MALAKGHESAQLSTLNRQQKQKAQVERAAVGRECFSGWNRRRRSLQLQTFKLGWGGTWIRLWIWILTIAAGHTFEHLLLGSLSLCVSVIEASSLLPYAGGHRIAAGEQLSSGFRTSDFGFIVP